VHKEPDESGVQTAVRQVLVGWDVITSNFLTLGRWTQDQNVTTSRVQIQLKELVSHMNDVGAKTRLLSAKIGQNPRGVEGGESTLWQALGDTDTHFKTMKMAVKNLSEAVKDVRGLLDNFGQGMTKMESNMTTMHNPHNNYLGCANKRMVALEKFSSAKAHAPRAQVQEGVFNFEQDNINANDFGNDVTQLRLELAEMRNQMTVLQADATNHPTADPMFPVNSLGEIMSSLKAVETRVTAAETCAIGGT
jgi:hypothetical protein